MPVLFADVIESTADPRYRSVFAPPSGNRVPQEIDKLFAAAKVQIPPIGKLTVATVDAVLEGTQVLKRLEFKAVLRDAGVID